MGPSGSSSVMSAGNAHRSTRPARRMHEYNLRTTPAHFLGDDTGSAVLKCSRPRRARSSARLRRNLRGWLGLSGLWWGERGEPVAGCIQSREEQCASQRGHTIPINVRQKARCRDDHRHITAQELSDPPVAIVMKGDPALVEGEIKGWGLSGRFGSSDIAYRPILFSRCAEMVLGGRQ